MNATSRYDRAAARFNGKLSSVAGGLAFAAIAAAGIWLGLYFGLPPIDGMADPLARLVFALRCACVAILFCFLTGIEAVSHERLWTPAFDPLAGRESQRLRINARYLQNTLEQLALFVPALLALASYCADGRSMRAVAASTAVWIIGRVGFWIGYHQGPQYRVFGLAGMVVSMLMLLYVVARFGYELAGIAGAVFPMAAFIAMEALLVAITKRPPVR
jgi:hypothetical protein